MHEQDYVDKCTVSPQLSRTHIDDIDLKYLNRRGGGGGRVGNSRAAWCSICGTISTLLFPARFCRIAQELVYQKSV